MNKYFIFIILTGSLIPASSQTLGGYLISDYLVTAIQSNGCNPDYVIGLPDDSTWVNFSNNDIITGNFGSARTDSIGDDLLLETSFHRDNYIIRLLLSNGLYSNPFSVAYASWTQITNVDWVYVDFSCTPSYAATSAGRYILPLDFNSDFGLTVNITLQGVYWVEVTVNNCSTKDLISVNFNPLPIIDLGNDTTLCQGDSLTISALTTNSSYLWQNNSTSPTLNITQQGIYSVEVTSNNCSSTDTISVNFNPLPIVDLGNNTTLCQGEIFTIDVTTPNSSYLWQDNSINPTSNITQQGIYWVEVTSNNCKESDTISVNFNPLPIIDLGNDTTICPLVTIILDATTSNASYLWQNNSTNPTLNTIQQGIYSVEVTSNNCSSTDEIIIQFEVCEVILEIPNIFTPNNDGVNDMFSPINSKGIVTMYTEIYNKWGDKVYKSNKLSINWNGEGVSDGTYFWIIYYTNINGNENNLKGTITILK